MCSTSSIRGASSTSTSTSSQSYSVSSSSATITSDVVVNILENMPLPSMPPTGDESYCITIHHPVEIRVESGLCSRRVIKNGFKIIGAGTGSTIGSLIATIPKIQDVCGGALIAGYLGNGLGAISNAASTYLACDTGDASRMDQLEAIMKQLEQMCYLETPPKTALPPSTVKNWTKIIGAGLFTFVGGAIGSDPRIATSLGISKLAAAYISAFVQGGANVASTYYFWDTGLEGRIADLRMRVDRLITRYPEDNFLTRTAERLASPPVIPMKMNFRNAAIAGVLTTIGGIIGGDEEIGKLMGASADIMASTGAVLGGLGNSASTYYPWDTGDTDQIDRLVGAISLLNTAVRMAEYRHTRV